MYSAMLHYRYAGLKISSVYYSLSYERNVTDSQYGGVGHAGAQPSPLIFSMLKYKILLSARYFK